MFVPKKDASGSIRKQTTHRQNIFKSVIESPFIIKWPRIGSELSGRLFDSLLKVIESVGEYRKADRSATKVINNSDKLEDSKSDSVIPRIVSEQRILVGINDVTKHLERMIQVRGSDKNLTENDLTGIKAPCSAIFICRRDIKPIHLCSHILTLAALAQVKLIPLPMDSEGRLSQALNLKRASVLFIEVLYNKSAEKLITNHFV
ncbi:hypothetical protein BC941DRAFT_426148 [Chlamydoabsidia padenii]|nr:hypothetical protein BC941DRAFT_426148 [Chlamydoabsidia padenii]